MCVFLSIAHIDLVSANRCLESAFRVLINISHSNPTWSTLLVHQRSIIPVVSSLIVVSPRAPHDAIDEAGEGGTQALDRQCLALGLITNLVQEEESSKHLCRETSEFCSLVSAFVPYSFFRARSFMSGSSPVRVRLHLSQRHRRPRVPCVRLRTASPNRGR